MKKSIILLFAMSLLVSCGSKKGSNSSEINSSVSNTTTITTEEESEGIDIKYITLSNEGTYNFEVTDGHAYAKYNPRCTRDAYFLGVGEIFESEFISWVKIHPLNNLDIDIGEPGFYYDNDEEDYWFMSSISVNKEYLNKEVIIDFCIDVNHMENGSKFELEFHPEEHLLSFTGECECGNYKSNKIYNFNFTKQLSITLETDEVAYIKFDTPRDNFVLYFYTDMNKDDLSTGIGGFTPHGDQYIRNSLYMVVTNQSNRITYDTAGVEIQYITLTNNSLDNITQTFTVSPR